MTGPFLLLHDADNVLVARMNAPEGLEITLDSGPVRLARPIPMAHKIARHAIAAGETIGAAGRLSVLPGITCTWQAGGRNDISFDEWMQLDMEYIDHWSLLLDMSILMRTVGAVVKGRGAV